MWLSCVWSERHESLKEQNKAFKLLSFSYKKKQNSSKIKRKKETEQNSLKKTKKRSRRRRRRKKGLRPVKKKTKKQRGRRRRTVSYGPIRPGEVFEFRPESAVSPDTARVGANQPDSARIGPSLRRVGVSRGKEKDAAPTRGHPSFTASVHPSFTLSLQYKLIYPSTSTTLESGDGFRQS